MTQEEDEYTSGEWQAVIVCDPGQFAQVESVVKDASKGRGSVMLLDLHEKNLADEIV